MTSLGHLAVPSCLVLLTIGARSAAQEPAPSPSPPSPPSMEELLAQARPGPEHERLARLVGDWDVELRPAGGAGEGTRGEGSARTILGGRFLVVDADLGSGEEASSYRFTLGFDRRHGEWSIVLMDTTGTYFVTARGPERDGVVSMAGSDDDPLMASMGYEKAFVFELVLEDDDAFAITTCFVDTRTQERSLIRYATHAFRRKGG